MYTGVSQKRGSISTTKGIIVPYWGVPIKGDY